MVCYTRAEIPGCEQIRTVDLQMEFGSLQQGLIAGKGQAARAGRRSARGSCQSPTVTPTPPKCYFHHPL